MIPKDCKRLAEVDSPIAEVSRHAAREKSIRHGHPSTLHLWWARRPLASSPAVLLALLWPDPYVLLCPDLLQEAVGLDAFVNADVIAQGLAAFSPESAAFMAGRIMLRRIDEVA